MTTNADLHARRLAAVPAGWASVHARYVASAANAELWDVEGNRLIDFTAGIGVLNTGHLHPRVIAAVSEQLRALSHSCFMVAGYEPAVELAECLNSRAPGPSAKKTMFVNSGAEAVENAVKIARYSTGRSGVIAFSGGFHGRTMMTMALTGKVSPYKSGFGPLPGDVFHAPYPYPYRGVTVDDSLDAVQRILHEDIEPSRVAALIVEPVLGEGGFVPAPPEFFVRIREVCDRHGIALVIDEVQSGFGRTGALFAIEHAGIEPDLMTMAKGIAGGFPLAAVSGKSDLMDAPHPGGVGGTYGGSPISCAAGLAVLDVIDEEDLLARAVSIGEQVTSRLRDIQARHPAVGDVRGLGAMVAMEMATDTRTKAPDPDITRQIVERAARHGLLLLSCGTFGNVIRFLPPLTATPNTIEEGLDILERCIDELVGKE